MALSPPPRLAGAGAGAGAGASTKSTANPSTKGKTSTSAASADAVDQQHAKLYGLPPARADRLISAHLLHLARELVDPLGAFAAGSNLPSTRKGTAGITKGADRVKAEATRRLDELRVLSRVYGLRPSQAHACVRMALGISLVGPGRRSSSSSSSGSGSAKAADGLLGRLLALAGEDGEEEGEEEDKEEGETKQRKRRRLHGGSLRGEPITPSVSLGNAFLKLVYPRPGVGVTSTSTSSSEDAPERGIGAAAAAGDDSERFYSREMVLDMLGCLGPAPGTLEPPKPKKGKKSGGGGSDSDDTPPENDNDDDDEDDEDGEAGRSGTKKEKEKKKRRDSTAGRAFRKHVPLKVQAHALKLLIMLLDTPAVALDLDADPSAAATAVGLNSQASTVSATAEGAREAVQQSLPSSFLSVAARRVLDKCYGVLFHFMEYQTLR